MNPFFKKIFFSSLLLLSFVVDAQAQDLNLNQDQDQDVNNSHVDQMPSYINTFEQDNSSSNDFLNNNSSFVSNDGNPLNGPNDPQDPNAPIDNKLYILLIVVVIYGIIDYKKVKQYKLKKID